MQKKSQITAFVIIGLIVMIMFGFVVLMKTSVKEKEFQREKEKVEDLFSERGKYYSYIKSCFEQVSKEAVLLSGMQGGAIYKEQGGARDLAMDKKMFKTHGKIGSLQDDYKFNVPFFIYESNYSFFPNGPPPLPEYPYGFTKITEKTTISSPFGNFPGLYPLIPLCDYDGPNSMFRKGIGVSCGNNFYSYTTKGKHNSIQYYLKVFIENKTLECVNLSNYPEVAYYKIESQNPNVTVVLSDDAVNVNMDMHITVSKEEQTGEISFTGFRTSVKVRLKAVHELVYRLLKEDINNLFFDIQKPEQLNECEGSTQCFKKGMSITKSRIILPHLASRPGFPDSLVRIVDAESIVDGKPFIFQFVVENRPPALDLVETGFPYSSENKYDIEVVSGDKITLRFKAYDPDEDNYISGNMMETGLRFSGWKETENDYFNPECFGAPPVIQDCFSDDNNLELRTMHNIAESDYPSLRPSDWPNTFNPSPHEWSNSLDYDAESGMDITEYTTSDIDIGAHNITVMACDAEYCDAQLIRIIVRNKGSASGVEAYADAPPNIASIEDPLTLSWPGIGDGEYTWVITKDGTEIYTTDTTKPELTIPYESEDNKDVKSFFEEDNSYTYKVTNEEGTEYQGSFDVKQCIPHRSINPPYPYNNLENPFSGDHTCCEGELNNPNIWTLAEPTKICYEDGVTGSLDELRGKFSISTNNIVDNEDNQVDFTDDNKNDVFRYEFKQQCGTGNTVTRGNACLGDITEATLVLVEECDDPIKDYGETNACEAAVGNECVRVSNGDSCGSAKYSMDENGEYILNQEAGDSTCNLVCWQGTCTIEQDSCT